MQFKENFDNFVSIELKDQLKVVTIGFTVYFETMNVTKVEQCIAPLKSLQLSSG